MPASLKGRQVSTIKTFKGKLKSTIDELTTHVLTNSSLRGERERVHRFEAEYQGLAKEVNRLETSFVEESGQELFRPAPGQGQTEAKLLLAVS
jgi:hypothetical protein